MGFIREEFKEERRNRRLAAMATVGGVGLLLVLLLMLVPRARKGDNPARRLAQKALAAQGAEAPAAPAGDLELPEIVDRVKGGVVTIVTFDGSGASIGMGTGFVVDGSGRIVTNHHVLQGAARAEVKAGGKTYPVAGFLAEDARSDLVIVAVGGAAGRAFPALPLAAEPPQVGEKVVVIGNPLGLELSVSDGIVAARRELAPYGQVIQITSPISPGSSGSPVLNLRGQVVGVATFGAVAGQNLNFAIPIAKVAGLQPAAEKALARLSGEVSEKLKKMSDPLEKAAYLIDEERGEEAVAYCEEVIRRDFGNARAHCLLGAAYIAGKPDRARNELKMALEFDPALAEAHRYLGVLHFATKQNAEAVAAIEEAVRLKPDYLDALVDLGAVYFAVGRFKSAAEVLNRALAIEENPKLLTVLGLTYTRLSRDLDAIRTLERAIAFDENAREAYVGLAYVTAKVKNWKRGIRYLSTALLRWPESPEMLFLLGYMHLGDEDVESAEEQLARLSAISKVKDAPLFRNKLQQAVSDFKRYRQLRGMY